MPKLNGIDKVERARNYLINGNMDIRQRGQSFAGEAEYTADRWRAQISGNVGTKNMETDVPNEESKYSLAINLTGSAAFVQVGQQIEKVNFETLLGKHATISYYVKAQGISTFTSRVRSSSVTEDVSVIFSAPSMATKTLNVSTGWTKVSHTFMIALDTKAMSIELNTGAMLNTDFIKVSQIMLNEGLSAAPFQTAGCDQ